MLLRLLLIFGIALLACTTAGAQLDEEPRKLFKELRALEGAWFYATDRGDRLEEWTRENDSTLTGLRYRIRENSTDTIILETLRLELRDTSILYSSVARNQNNNEPVIYRLVKADYDGYLFETAMIDNPQKINYLLLGNREIQINTEGKKGTRTVTEEYIYEREFAKSSTEFRLRAGLNMNTMTQTGTFNTTSGPDYGWRLGWDAGAGMLFKGQGGFFALNVEINMAGKNTDVSSAFDVINTNPPSVDTFVRDGHYRSTWIQAAFIPEFFPVREGAFSILAGPYISRLIGLRTVGTALPEKETGLFDASDDWNKTDIGIAGGFHYRFKTGEKDLGSLLGLRASIGFSDLDNLYDRGCDNAAFCNGQLFLRGISLYYSMNLLKL